MSKVIKTDEEHAVALKRVEALWKAQPGSPEEEELELLSILVEAYERKRWPIEPPADPTSLEAENLISEIQQGAAELPTTRTRDQDGQIVVMVSNPPINRKIVFSVSVDGQRCIWLKSEGDAVLKTGQIDLKMRPGPLLNWLRT